MSALTKEQEIKSSAPTNGVDAAAQDGPAFKIDMGAHALGMKAVLETSEEYNLIIALDQEQRKDMALAQSKEAISAANATRASGKAAMQYGVAAGVTSGFGSVLSGGTYVLTTYVPWGASAKAQSDMTELQGVRAKTNAQQDMMRNDGLKPAEIEEIIAPNTRDLDQQAVLNRKNQLLNGDITKAGNLAEINRVVKDNEDITQLGEEEQITLKAIKQIKANEQESKQLTDQLAKLDTQHSQDINTQMQRVTEAQAFWNTTMKSVEGALNGGSTAVQGVGQEKQQNENAKSTLFTTAAQQAAGSERDQTQAAQNTAGQLQQLFQILSTLDQNNGANA